MLRERAKKIREEINQFDDDFSKYSFLVELSAYIPANQPDLMIKENTYKACQSQVWLKMSNNDGKFHLCATSDTLIIRGILYIMMELYNGISINELNSDRIDFLKCCGIEKQFTSERTDGIRGINNSIYEFCAMF